MLLRTDFSVFPSFSLKLHVICTTSSCYLLSKSLDCEFDLSYITFLKLCNNPFCREELACVKTNETFMMNISSYIFLFLAITKTKIKRYLKCNCWCDNIKNCIWKWRKFLGCFIIRQNKLQFYRFMTSNILRTKTKKMISFD